MSSPAGSRTLGVGKEQFGSYFIELTTGKGAFFLPPGDRPGKSIYKQVVTKTHISPVVNSIK
jgi:hypothetical protein